MELSLQIRVLETVEKFGYVTNHQMVEIGLSSYRVIARETQYLSEKKMIRKYKYGVHARLGKYEDFHVLASKGADLLKESGIVSLKCPFHLRKKPLVSEFFHRKLCVELHIQIWTLLQKRYPQLVLSSWETYFQKNGGSNATHDPKRPAMQSQTFTMYDPKHQRAFIPDVIFRIHNPEKDKWLFYAVEVTNSGRTSRTLNQLWRHTHAIENRSIGKRYGTDSPHIMLSLFSERSWMESVQREFGKKCPRQYQGSFFFITTNDLKQNPEAWFRGISPQRFSILSLQPL